MLLGKSAKALRDAATKFRQSARLPPQALRELHWVTWGRSLTSPRNPKGGEKTGGTGRQSLEVRAGSEESGKNRQT